MNEAESIHDHAREITDPEKRKIYLEEACRGDGGLRDRVEELLARGGEPDSPAEPEETRESPLPKAPPLVATTSLMPDQIGPYRVLERLGYGGMGEVFRAEQRVPFRREVALKLIKLGMDTKQVVARFEAERQAMALMDHPHIAKVYGADMDERGRPYFAMEYVKGIPITEYADINHLTVRQRLELFQQVCHAIQHAHQKGVIHRDIKPSNILVSTQDGQPHAKVIDFGIAKATSQQLTDMTVFTLHDQLIGTPQYMSPEQATGSLDIDTRTDVYSLGVLLYELLTGKTPFDQARLRKAALHDIARILRDEEPPKPSTRLGSMAGIHEPAGDLDPAGGLDSSRATGSTLDTLAKARSMDGQQLLKEVKGELDWLVMKALDKDRARRYDSPNSMAEDIGRFLSGSPIEAAPPTFRYRAGKFVARNKAAMVVAGVIAGLVLLSLFGTLTGLVQARKSLAREKEAAAREAAAREAAEYQAYVANIGAAQVSMQGESWPEARARLDACAESMRGWEWKYLRALASAPEYGFAEPVSQVQLSEGERFLLCRNSEDCSVIDLATRRKSGSFKLKQVMRSWSGGSSYESNGEATITSSGLVVAASGEEISIHDSTGGPLGSFKIDGEVGGIESMEASGDGRYLFISHEEKGFLACDLAARKQLWSVRGFEFLVRSRDGTLLYGSDGSTIVGISVATGEKKWEARPSVAGSMYAYDITPDGSKVALTKERGKVLVSRDATGTTWSEIEAADEVESVTLSEDGAYLLLSVGDPVSLQVWNVATGKQLAATARMTGGFFSADGRVVYSLQAGQIWDWQKGDGAAAFVKPAGSSSVQAFSRDGGFAISVDNYRVRVWKTARMNLQPDSSPFKAEAAGTGIFCARFGGRDLLIEEWCGPVADAVEAAFESADSPSAVVEAASRDGRFVARADADFSVVVETRGKAAAARLKGNEGAVRSMVFTPDGTRLVTGSEDGTVRFWETGSWRELAVFRDSYAIQKVAFVGGGTRLVVVLGDRSIKSFDIRNVEDRVADEMKLREERLKVAPKVAGILSGSTPWRDLASPLVTGDVSPWLRRVALAEMEAQLADVRDQASSKLKSIRTERVIRRDVEAAVGKLDCTPLVRKAIESELAGWKQERRELREAMNEIMGESLATPERYQVLKNIALFLLEGEGDRFEMLCALGTADFRLGNYPAAIQSLQEAEGIAIKRKQVDVELARCRAFLAMALFKAGRANEAMVSLGEATNRLWLLREKKLRQEAVAMIQPLMAKPAVPTARISPQVAGDAVNAADDEILEAKISERIRVRGKVHGVRPTVARDQVSLDLDQSNPGFTAFINRRAVAGLNDVNLEELMDREIVVTGTLSRRGEDYQIPVENWDEVALVATPEELASLPPEPERADAYMAKPSPDTGGPQGKGARPRSRTEPLWQVLEAGANPAALAKAAGELAEISDPEASAEELKALDAAIRYRQGDWKEAARLFSEIPFPEDLSKVVNWSLQARAMAFRAMCLWRTDNRGEAIKALRLAMLFVGKEDFTPLQKEAAALIAPAATAAPAKPGSEAYLALAEATDASDVSALKARAGQVSRVKGRITRVCPTFSGSGVNLFLNSTLDGPLVWVSLKTIRDTSLAKLMDLEGMEVEVDGKVALYGGSKEEWKSRMQITLENAAGLRPLDPSAPEPRWWEHQPPDPEQE